MTCFAQSPSPVVPARAAAASTAAPEPVKAGIVSLVGGEVRVVTLGSAARRVSVGDAVNEGDTLVTGKDSEVHVTMQDAGFIALRPNTRMQIVSYKADGGDEDHGVFRLVTGGLRSITGWIGKFNQKAYQVRTPDATISIRGTDHETRYVPEGSSDGPRGTYDKVFAGGTTIQTRAGDADVEPNQAGFVASGGAASPRVLASVPAFFQPGPNEALINSKHAEIQKVIEQRREERRKIVEAKRAELALAQADMKALGESNKAASDQSFAAGDRQRLDGDQQRAALRAQEVALDEKQKSIVQMRQMIQQETAPDIARDPELLAQLKPVRNAFAELRAGFDALRADKQALYDRNMAATEARKAAADAQRAHSEQQLAIWNEKLKALQQKQKAIQDIRQALQKASAGDAGKTANLTEQRKDVNAMADEAALQQHEYVDGMNTLFNDNMNAAQASNAAASDQRADTETQLAAFNVREEALRHRQGATEEAMESVQRSSATVPDKRAMVSAQIMEVHAAAEELRLIRLDIQARRYALNQTELAATKLRQQEASDRMQKMRQTHQDVQDKIADLQQESASMQEEIKMLYEQEQKRYREELKADRQQRVLASPKVEDN